MVHMELQGFPLILLGLGLVLVISSTSLFLSFGNATINLCHWISRVWNLFIFDIQSFILQAFTEKKPSLGGNSALLNNVGTVEAGDFRRWMVCKLHHEMNPI